jgi:lysophospholipase L1-like esterase
VLMPAAMVCTALMAAALYLVVRVQRLPANAPGRLVRDRNRPVVVCAGASVTQGNMGVGYVDLLEARLGHLFQFANAGRNGDLAFNLAERLDAVVALQPDAVVLQIGTNDVNASLAPEVAERYRRIKKLPSRPDRDFYRDNLLRILRRLGTETSARVAILSLPPIGEDLESTSNRQVRSYNEVLRAAVAAEGIGYLPVYERMAEALVAQPSPRAAPPANRLIGQALVQRYLLGRSFDRIAASNGYQFLTDGIHLNSRGAAVVADQIEDWLVKGVDPK